MGKKGLVVRVCRSSNQPKCIQQKRAGTQKEEKVHTLSGSRPQSNLPLLAVVSVNGAPLAMETDMGATVSLISENTYMSCWSTKARPHLEHTNVLLKAYAGRNLSVAGHIIDTFSYQNQSHRLSL